VIAQRKDGTTFPIDLAVSQFHDRDGMMFTGIIRDISERKLLERHLAESRIEERRYLAQEIHDGLGGLLTGVSMLATALQSRLERDNHPEAKQASRLVDHLRDAHQHLRGILRGLLPIDVAPDGLPSALHALAEKINESQALTCEARVVGEVEVRSPVDATHLYRIAQVAVTNSVRHGRATRIDIRLEERDDRVMLTVHDNGRGIQGSSDTGQGMGLRTMAYRANQIRAALAVRPADGGGTLVRCSYPKSPALR